MSPADHSKDCWPTPQQELLLQAALLQGEDALSAWRQWLSTADLDRLDQASFGLLPLLHQNLRRHGMEHPLMDRLKGIRRMTWYKNWLLFHGAANALRALDRAGIRHMLLKGASLALLHYRDLGLRPMGDVDILVPHRQALEAIGALTASGWVPKGQPPDLLTDQYVSIMTRHSFSNGAQQDVDLHWHVLSSDRGPDGVNEALWREAVPTAMHDVPTLALRPTDLLLHVCQHGVKWNPTPAFRWAADATILVSREPSGFDWDHLVAEAQLRHLTLPLITALTYIGERLGAPVPSQVLRALRDIPTTRLDRVEHELSTYRANPILFPLRRLRRHYMSSTQRSPEAHLPQRLRAFVRYLRMYWQVPHWGMVPGQAWRRAKRLIAASMPQATHRPTSQD